MGFNSVFKGLNKMADGKCRQSLQYRTWMFTVLNPDRSMPIGSGYSEERKKQFPCPEYIFQYAGA